MGQWLEGKTVADVIKNEVQEEVARYKSTRNVVPGLIGILVGENPASQVYLRTKEKTSRALGLFSEILSFPADMTAGALKAEIERLNQREDVDGILIQLPLPAHLSSYEIISTILPEKDVDGLHPFNLGSLLMNQDCLKPCTPLGIMELLRFHGIGIESKQVVVIGRSLLVGKSLAAMMTNKNGTVTLCHSKTQNLAEVCSGADILVAAMGRAAFVLPEFVKAGATVIDVGMNSLADAKRVQELFGDEEKRRNDLKGKGYTLVGDVDPRVIQKARYLTPVPGGVGLLTVAMLMKNTLEAFKKRKKL
jgi:methylenetetrahydrofolate dehydrogenase (NADP+)/methenyltetrahydrofolate cyclohydrolase